MQISKLGADSLPRDEKKINGYGSVSVLILTQWGLKNCHRRRKNVLAGLPDSLRREFENYLQKEWELKNQGNRGKIEEDKKL